MKIGTWNDLANDGKGRGEVQRWGKMLEFSVVKHSNDNSFSKHYHISRTQFSHSALIGWHSLDFTPKDENSFC